jgi:diguanylate cyclase (GGDEF)-like protein
MSLHHRCGRAAVLLAALAGMFLAAVASAAPAAEPVVLQLKWRHQFQFAGYYAAQEKGYYREAGLDMHIVEADAGTDPVEEVVAGRAQYGVGSSALLLDRQKGQPVVALAAIFQHSPLLLLARATPGMNSIHDLAGKRLMLEPHAEELVAYLRKEGVPESLLKIVPHDLDRIDLDRADAASAYSTDEPYFLERAGVRYLGFSPRSGGIDFYGDNLFTSRRELAEHPARVAAFRAASMKGWKYAMQHPEEIADLILAKYSKRHSREHLLYEARQMVPLIQPALVEMGYMYPGRWRHIADTYAELGLLPRDFTLGDFLYDPEADRERDRRRLLLAMAIAVGIGVVCGGVALVFIRLNGKLKREIAARAATTAELEAKLAEIQALHASIEEMAVRDPLTGLHNRRHLDENFERELARAKREGRPLTLAVIDIDEFKRINDTFGHPAGDHVLKSVAELLLHHTRASDLVCRHGGDEFLVLMPDMAAADARECIDRWRTEFAAAPLRHGVLEMQATLSIGVATFPDNAHSVDTMTSMADLALYFSKQNGRNRTTLYSDAAAGVAET